LAYGARRWGDTSKKTGRENEKGGQKHQKEKKKSDVIFHEEGALIDYKSGWGFAALGNRGKTFMLEICL